MLIINADDWGRSKTETDAALACFKAGRITSVTAMVYMEDSELAAAVAKTNALSAGLHLNFSQPFNAVNCPERTRERHAKNVKFLTANKYAQLVYNPFLRQAMAGDCTAQLDEFLRLYGKPPTHVDGHHHMHLCANMVFSRIIPVGTKMRRNFSFWPGEKSLLNRAYRGFIDRVMSRRYHLPDYLFCLLQSIESHRMDRVIALARAARVELMTHPIIERESSFLLSQEFLSLIQGLPVGGYSVL